MDPNDAKENSLITFPPSTGCESVVWLLKMYDLPVNIRLHTIPFFAGLIWLNGGGSQYPLLQYQGTKMCSSKVIYRHLPYLIAPEKNLLPLSQEEQKTLYKIWNEGSFHYFDVVPNWAYHYLLPRKDLLLDPLTKGVPGWEKEILRAFYTPLTGIIKKSLKINYDKPPTQSENMIRKGFDYFDQLLSDGRPYLMGDSLTILDIATSSFAAPAVFESKYGNGGLLPPFEEAPSEMVSFVNELRERPTAHYVKRIYNQYR